MSRKKDNICAEEQEYNKQLFQLKLDCEHEFNAQSKLVKRSVKYDKQ